MDGHLGELRAVPGAYHGTSNQSQSTRTPKFIQDKESQGNNSLHDASAVSFRPIHFGDRPSDRGESALHFAVNLEDFT